MTSDISIRRLMPDVAEKYRMLRLAALRESPEAFGSDFAAESASPVEKFTATVRDTFVAGAFRGERLVGVAGFYQLDRAKTRHRGNIWGVYVAPDARGAGVGRQLVEFVIAHARTQVLQVHLAVTAGNSAATALYEHLGFVAYGREPRALSVDGRYLDEVLMVLRFD